MSEGITPDQFRKAMKVFREETPQYLAFGGAVFDDDWTDAESKSATPFLTHFVDVLNRVCAPSTRELTPEAMAEAIAKLEADHGINVQFNLPVRKFDGAEDSLWGAESVFGSSFVVNLTDSLKRTLAGEPSYLEASAEADAIRERDKVAMLAASN